MLGVIIGYIILGIVWGIVVDRVVENKGYEENWFWWGFFFEIFALIVALTKPNNYTQYASYSQESMQESPLPQAAHQQRENQLLQNNGWKCNRCGRVNPNYTGTCACGVSKAESERWITNKAEKEPEPDDFQKIKSYKDLLDAGVITQEEFDKKKKDLLKL